MNDFLHRFLQVIAETLGVSRQVLFDYDEVGNTFDLLYFHGHPADARASLRRRMRELDLQRALEQRDPCVVAGEERELLVPLYFMDTLEAVLLIELETQTAEDEPELGSALQLVCRMLGLFMSSSRLPVNERQQAAANPLERAREVQLSYLPRVEAATNRYEIFGHNQSSALVGGDYFDYFSYDRGTLQFVIADACGHGMTAARTISAFRQILHTEARARAEVRDLFTRINSRLYRNHEQFQYLTAVFCDFDQGTGELRYLNAGHYPPLLVRAAGDHCWLEGSGLPLGMFEEAGYEAGRTEIAPGDLLVLFTDGIVDLQNHDEEFYGVERIREAVLEHRVGSLRSLAGGVLGRAERFSSKSEPDDDLTLFMTRFR